MAFTFSNRDGLSNKHNPPQIATNARVRFSQIPYNATDCEMSVRFYCAGAGKQKKKW